MKKNEYVFLAIVSALLSPILLAIGSLFAAIWFLIVLVVCLIKLNSMSSKGRSKGLVDSMMSRE